MKRQLPVADLRKGLSEKEVRSGGACPQGDMSRRDKPLSRQDLAKIGLGQLPFQGSNASPTRPMLCLRQAFVLLLAVGALGGCARRYDVTLTSGQHLTNIPKPILNRQGGFYYYVDSHGRTNTLPATRVVEIEPHQESKFKSPQ